MTISYAGFDLMRLSGAEGNRTPVTRLKIPIYKGFFNVPTQFDPNLTPIISTRLPCSLLLLSVLEQHGYISGK